MDARKILDKLEHKLSHFLISETCKADPTKRGTPELYRYKGLSMYADPKSISQEKTVHIRIGALEAEFRINNCEKNSGCLAPEDERLIMIWLAQSDNNTLLRSIFLKKGEKKQIAIIPFDLEEYYNND